MRKTLTTVALLLALSCTAFGGEMSTPPAPQPQPATAVQEPTDGTTLNGKMPNPGEIHTTGASDILTQTALDLLALLPSLL